jgi:hypothetical protein
MSSVGGFLVSPYCNLRYPYALAASGDSVHRVEALADRELVARLVQLCGSASMKCRSPMQLRYILQV